MPRGARGGQARRGERNAAARREFRERCLRLSLLCYLSGPLGVSRDPLWIPPLNREEVRLILLRIASGELLDFILDDIQID